MLKWGFKRSHVSILNGVLSSNRNRPKNWGKDLTPSVRVNFEFSWPPKKGTGRRVTRATFDRGFTTRPSWIRLTMSQWLVSFTAMPIAPKRQNVSRIQSRNALRIAIFQSISPKRALVLRGWGKWNQKLPNLMTKGTKQRPCRITSWRLKARYVTTISVFNQIECPYPIKKSAPKSTAATRTTIHTIQSTTKLLTILRVSFQN